MKFERGDINNQGQAIPSDGQSKQWMGGEMKSINDKYVLNKAKIISLNIQIKACDGQMEQYRLIDQYRYQQVITTKTILMEQYQQIIEEQNLINTLLKEYQNNQQGPMNNTPMVSNDYKKQNKPEVKLEDIKLEISIKNKTKPYDNDDCCTGDGCIDMGECLHGVSLCC